MTTEQLAETDGMRRPFSRPFGVDRPALQPLDRVRIAGGKVLIVTQYNPHKPANCYTGVLENGQGKAYVFGPKHRPEKIGVVTSDHPAIRANAQRSGAGQVVQPQDQSRPVVMRLIEAVEAKNYERAAHLIAILKEMGFKS